MQFFSSSTIRPSKLSCRVRWWWGGEGGKRGKGARREENKTSRLKRNCSGADRLSGRSGNEIGSDRCAQDEINSHCLRLISTGIKAQACQRLLTKRQHNGKERKKKQEVVVGGGGYISTLCGPQATKCKC